jgi:hypothetical protein
MTWNASTNAIRVRNRSPAWRARSGGHVEQCPTGPTRGDVLPRSSSGSVTGDDAGNFGGSFEVLAQLIVCQTEPLDVRRGEFEMLEQFVFVTAEFVVLALELIEPTHARGSTTGAVTASRKVAKHGKANSSATMKTTTEPWDRRSEWGRKRLR